ncbi:MAG TPA: ABC transporter substrate-binding protein, partial [Chloroflexota bacterium]|nr:ABC transporter substrate-binding protein [Chloroflexota bacterium]
MILREAFDYEFSPLDPATGAHIDPPSVAIYETLILKGPDNVPYPMLAESWEVGAGGLEWRVRLRPGLRFHSGAPCDAAAVLAALHVLRYGGGDRQVGYWDPVDEVRAEGSNTLIFRLHYPYARLPSLLWGTHTAVLGESTRTRGGDRYGRTVVDGTGPFRCVEWSPARIVAERWEQYPGA